jgi:hypothetical protein
MIYLLVTCGNEFETSEVLTRCNRLVQCLPDINFVARPSWPRKVPGNPLVFLNDT